MRKKEKRIVSIESETISSITCDHCKQDITNNENDYFFQVVTSHNDWGNDSRDSIRELDFCGPRCLSEHFAAYFARANGSEEYNAERVDKRSVLNDE